MALHCRLVAEGKDTDHNKHEQDSRCSVLTQGQPTSSERFVEEIADDSSKRTSEN